MPQMGHKQNDSFISRAQRFFRSSIGCTEAAPSRDEVSVEKSRSYDLRDQPPAQVRSFHEDYQLKGKLGKGAFAQVYVAHAATDGAEVAVKITDLRGSGKGDLTEPDARMKRAVEKEVQVLRRVGAQEYCVHFYGDYSEGLLSYIIMERCDMTLLQALERTPDLTEQTLVGIFREMLLGLHEIHRLGVVHRDIKPDNFLCTGSNCKVKLCDFGLAEVLQSQSAELKGVYGTAPFMSPEMLGASSYGAGTDIWSLGVIVYVLLFGQFPYQPVETTAKAMKACILAGVPAPTFKTKANLDFGGRFRTSNAALEFLYGTLNRNKAARLTAAACIKHTWMSGVAEDPGQQDAKWGSPSLRPMLYSAKRAGAFDTRGVSPNDKPSGVDLLLSAIRGQQQPPEGQKQDPPARLSTASTAEMASPKAGRKLEKSSTVISNTSHASTATGDYTSATGGSTYFNSSARSKPGRQQ